MWSYSESFPHVSPHPQCRNLFCNGFASSHNWLGISSVSPSFLGLFRVISIIQNSWCALLAGSCSFWGFMLHSLTDLDKEENKWNSTGKIIKVVQMGDVIPLLASLKVVIVPNILSWTEIVGNRVTHPSLQRVGVHMWRIRRDTIFRGCSVI